MELLHLLAALSVVVSLLLAPCSSSSTASDHEINRQKPLQQYGNSAVHQQHFTLLSLPRKLNLQEEAAVKKSSADDEDHLPRKILIEASSGKKRQDEKGESMMVHDDEQAAAGRGTWREWAESPRRSEYFSMDYAWVRRRRPIHNKKIPLVP